MAKVYSVKTDSGSSELPITNGFYYTDVMNKGHEAGTFAIAFYDVNGDIVTPTGGTITTAMEIIDGQWHGPSSGANPISAIDCGTDGAYEIQAYNGPATRGRITLNGIAGVDIDHVKAEFWRD